MAKPGSLYSFASNPLLKRFGRRIKDEAGEFAANPYQYMQESARAALPPDPLGGYNAQGVPQMNPEATKWLADNVGLGAMIVYHGSPHVFDKFNMSKIGTGEGAQAYGHGVYLAESKKVADEYAGKLSKHTVSFANGAPATDAERELAKRLQTLADTTQYGSKWGAINDSYRKAIDPFIDSRFHDEKQIARLLERKEAAKRLGAPDVSDAGYLYKIDIPDEAVERMLDWDAPLSGNQLLIDAVRREVPGYMQLPPGQTKAQDAYYALSEKVGEKKAAQVLRDAGIPGIKYFDGQSRAGAEGTRNFVLFDDRLPRILERNGQATGLKPWKPGEYRNLLLNAMESNR